MLLWYLIISINKEVLMKKFCFLMLLTFTFVSSNSDAFEFMGKQNNESRLVASSQSSVEDLVSSNSVTFEFKNEQKNESKLDASSQLSEEEIDGADVYIDVVSHMEGEIDGTNYTINTSMELYKHSGKTKTKVIKFDARGLADNTFETTSVSVFKFGDYHFFEIGTFFQMEGYMAAIHVVDLKNKKVLSKFDKCANQEEFFGLQRGILTYMCKWLCLKNKYAAFEPKEKKFITINEKHDCSKLSFNDKRVGLNQTDFKFKYKKEKTEKNSK